MIFEMGLQKQLGKVKEPNREPTTLEIFAVYHQQKMCIAGIPEYFAYANSMYMYFLLEAGGIKDTALIKGEPIVRTINYTRHKKREEPSYTTLVTCIAVQICIGNL